ncbi:MAG TPA: SpoIID/LytB domain-containing protein [Thermoleophilaceae bacterium]|nr:SpoIID/LytB domain-containing protein [Thermoleophilaceae bacterium]
MIDAISVDMGGVDRTRQLVARLVALLVLTAPVATARADLRVDGHGNGHGIGMSQYGAYGYALETRHTYPYILGHYYPGTTLRRTGGRTIRVLLKEGPTLLVSEATTLTAAGRSPIALHGDRTYRFEPAGAGLLVFDTRAGRTKARVASPATVTGSSTVRLRGRAQNGVMSGRYRGQLTIAAGSGGLTAMNRIDLELYLRGVVPSEMPSGWPLQALDAQAVAARSYAIRSLAPAAPFDVYADTRSQVYRGVAAESSRSTASVSGTRSEALFYGGNVAATYFSSSSGGRTAAVDEEWGGPPVPYLRSVADPYDRRSPWHDWSLAIPTADAEKRLGTLLQGTLQGIAVTARNSSGRAALVEIRGSEGMTQATGVQVRTALGLRSTWFTLRFATTAA